MASRTAGARGSRGKFKWIPVHEQLKRCRDNAGREEVLRPFVLALDVMVGEVDPDRAPIRFKHLQALAKQWKLPQKHPGLWKRCRSHPDLLRVICLHVDEMAHKELAVVRNADTSNTAGAKRTTGYGYVFKPYTGDMFGTRGDYNEGLIYASRMPINSTQLDQNPMQPKDSGDKHAATGASPRESVHTEGEDERKDVAGDGGDGDGDGTGGGGAYGDESGGAVNTGDGFNFANGATTDSGLKIGDASSTASLLELSTMPDLTSRRSCAAALASLAAKPAFHPTLVKAGAVEALLTLYDNKDRQIRGDAITALCNIMASINDPSILKNGPLTVTIQGLGGSDDPELRSLCLRTIVKMSADETNRRSLVEEGAINVVVDLIRTGDEPDGPLYSELMHNLARIHDNRSAIIRDGAVHTLLRLMQRQKGESQTYATLALLDLIRHNSASKESIIQAGAVTVVVALSRSPVNGTSEAAFSAVEECAVEVAGRTALMESGALADLIELAKADAGRMRERATGVLKELALDPTCRTQLVAEGAVQALVSLSGSGNGVAERNCAVALCSLLIAGDAAQRDVEEQSSLLQMGALGALRALASSEDVRLQRKAAHTLCELSYDDELAARVVQQGGLATLMALAECDDATIRGNCAIGLHNLSARRAHHPVLLEQGGVGALMELAADKEPSVKARCAAGLSNMSYYKAGLHKLAGAGLLDTMIALSKSEAAKFRCAIGLCNLSSHQPARLKMVLSGVVPILIGLSRCNQEVVKQDCVRALCNLSCQRGCERNMAEDGAASGLIMIALFRSDALETKELCVRSLFNLMHDPESRRRLIKDEVVWAFTKLACSDGINQAVRVMCAQALFSLSLDPETRARVMQQRAMQALALVSRVPSAATKRAAAAAIRNLSWDAVPLCKMAKEGVVTPLLELASEAHPSVSHQVAGALANLTCERQSCDTLTEHNAIDVVLALAQHDDEHVLWCCAMALANMTALPDRAQALVEQRVVAALVTLTRTAEARTTRLCGSSLYNLTCDPDALPAAIDAGLVRALVTLVNSVSLSASESKDPDGVPEAVLRLCAAAACNCASVPSCRPRIADAGICNALLQILAATCREDTVSFVANAFCHMSAHPDCLMPMAKADVVPVLIRLAKSGSTPAVSTALTRVLLRVISNLSHSREVRPLLVKQGAVAAMVAQSNLHTADASAFAGDSDKESTGDEFKDDPHVSGSARRATAWRLRGEYHEAAGLFLWMLSGEACASDAILDDGGLTALLTLARHEDLDMKNLVAAALMNLSRLVPSRLVALDEVVPTLSALAKTEDEDTRRVCATALRNLSGNEDSQAQMMQDGGVEMLVQFMMSSEGASAPVPAPDFSRTAKSDFKLLPPDDHMLVLEGIGVRAVSSKELARTESERLAGAGRWTTVAEVPLRASTKPLIKPMTVDDDSKDIDVAARGGGAAGGEEEIKGGPRQQDVNSIPASRLWPKVQAGGMAVSGLAPPEPAPSGDGKGMLATIGQNRGVRGRRLLGSTVMNFQPLLDNARINKYFQPRLRGTWAPSHGSLPQTSPVGGDHPAAGARPHSTPAYYGGRTPASGFPGNEYGASVGEGSLPPSPLASGGSGFAPGRDSSKLPPASPVNNTGAGAGATWPEEGRAKVAEQARRQLKEGRLLTPESRVSRRAGSRGSARSGPREATPPARLTPLRR